MNTILTILAIGFVLFALYVLRLGIYLAKHYRDGGFLLEKRLGRR